MATLLFRLGRFSFRHRAFTLVLWLGLLASIGFGAATLSGPTDDAVSIPGTESWRAMDVLGEKFGVGSNSASAKVVVTVPGTGTLTDPERRAAVTATVAALRAAPQVGTVTDPYQSGNVAPDGRTAYASVTYPVPETEVRAASRQALFAAGDAARDAGLGVEYSGEVTATAEASNAAEGIGILVAAVVLLITFGSVLAAGLPLLTAILGVAAGMLGIAVASGFFDLASNTAALATMLGLAVGIDYALFIVSRYRHELAAGHDGAEAAGRAVGTAGSAVVFAGLTVVIALAALTVIGIPFLAAMGLAAAGTVAVAVVISLTLLPALLAFAGRRILPRAARRDPAARPVRTPFGERWARGVLRYRLPALILSLFAVGVVALPVADLNLALPDDGTAAPDSTRRKAYDQLANGFGAGINGPLVILVETTGGRAGAAAEQARNLVSGLDGVVVVTPAQPDPAGDAAMFTVLPRSGPTSAQTRDLVHDIRARQAGFTDATDGATLSVTGRTAIDIDIAQKINGALLPYLGIVLGLAFVLLLLVFRSVLVPIKAALGFLVSVAASFGALVFIFQQGHLADLFGIESTGPIVSFTPIFLIGILFGLAMDYEVFLVTRTREEFRGGAPDDAIVSGMRHSARVVTAAALIMMSVFAGFVLSDDVIIKSLGFALAFGVAVDALLVRMTVGPALLSLLGRSAWWLPGWLDRILPNVDVDGARLDAAPNVLTSASIQAHTPSHPAPSPPRG